MSKTNNNSTEQKATKSKPKIKKYNKDGKFIPNGRMKGSTQNTWKWFDEYKNFQGKNVPISTRFIDELAKEYIEWATDDEKNTALIMSSFSLMKGIPPDTFWRWTNESEVLGRAHKIAITAVGNRRELGGLSRRLDSSLVSHSMPSYNPEWRELLRYKASLKDITASTNVQKVIIMEKITMPEEKPKEKTLPDKEHKTPEDVARRVSMWGSKETHEPER